MRVLVFCAETVSAPVRIVPMLDTLREAGAIDGYSCVDRDMAISGSRSAFDVAVAHRNPSRRQIAWLRQNRVPFLYDIDDLLLTKDERVTARRSRERDAIRWCLENAHIVTSPSRRLLATLELRLGQPLAPRAVYLPNAGLASEVASDACERPALLWVSSHGQDYDEYREVAAGIAAAAQVSGLDVVLVGRFAAPVHDILAAARHVPWIDPRDYGMFLSRGCFVAAAPMPVSLAPGEQEFIDCKSDIKLAQYASVGIPVLCSPALPYRESELPSRIAPSNSAADWRQGLLDLVKVRSEVSRSAADHPATRARRPSALATSFGDLLRSVHGSGSRSFRFRSVPTPAVLRRVEQGVRALRARLRRVRPASAAK